MWMSMYNMYSIKNTVEKIPSGINGYYADSFYKKETVVNKQHTCVPQEL